MLGQTVYLLPPAGVVWYIGGGESIDTTSVEFSNPDCTGTAYVTNWWLERALYVRSGTNGNTEYLAKALPGTVTDPRYSRWDVYVSPNRCVVVSPAATSAAYQLTQLNVPQDWNSTPRSLDYVTLP